MKSYLNFTLKGSQFLPVWIAFFFFFMIPYYFLLGEFNELISSDVPAGGPSKLFFIYLAFVLAMAYTFVYYMVKLVVQSLEYKGEKVLCNYHLGKYIGIIITGLVLSIVSVGIYVPWLIKNIHRFFTNGTSYNSHKFSFKGKGGKLFLIMTLTIFIPFLLVGIVLFSIFESMIDFQSQNFLLIYQLIVMFSLVPNIYLILKWMVDFRYKDYLIRWDTEFFPATGKIAIELVFAVVTFGIYFPMAYIRLYRYFAEHTKSNVVNEKQISLGYNGDLLSDFLFMWGQILLTVITLGFYYPWAFSRIAQRVLTQTYLETNVIVSPDK
ncbi:MAG: DUF898 domain-containing protein [Mariniphaga sp.]|nr:DUF898 domain-containing protein [Mariniphaga sp.]